jgi:hypothetical protein
MDEGVTEFILREALIEDRDVWFRISDGLCLRSLY